MGWWLFWCTDPVRLPLETTTHPLCVVLPILPMLELGWYPQYNLHAPSYGQTTPHCSFVAGSFPPALKLVGPEDLKAQGLCHSPETTELLQLSLLAHSYSPDPQCASSSCCGGLHQLC